MAANINALIIDPVRRDRLRLKEVSYGSEKFDRVDLVESLSAARRWLDELGTEVCSIIFISSSFPYDSISKWIETAKDITASQDSAYILVMEAAQQEKTVAAANVLMGIDGFLLEPYGVGAVEDVIKLASQVKRNRQLARKAAVELLVDESMIHLDMAAGEKLRGKSPEERLKYFRKLGKVLFRLSEANLEWYYDVVLTKFPLAELPKTVVSGKKNDPVAEALRRSVTAEKAEEEILNEAVTKLKKRLQQEGIDTKFLDEAVVRIRKRMSMMGIFADFIEDDDQMAEEKITQKRQVIVTMLRERFAAKGISAAIFDLDEDKKK